MKKFLLLTLFVAAISSLSAQSCVMDTTGPAGFIEAGQSGSATGVFKTFDFTTGNQAPAAANSWSVTCDGCASQSVQGGADGQAGAQIDFTAPASSQNITLTFSAVDATTGTCTASSTITLSVLPVEFKSFTAQTKADEVVLNWTTSMELNNDFFTVERSFDAKDFSEVSKILGAGDSNEELDYSYTDEEVLRYASANTVYYRLKQTDFDGVFSYSEVISVELKTRDNVAVNNVAVAANTLTVNFETTVDGEATLSVFDLNGRLISTVQQFALQGYNSAELDLNNAPNGVYFVRLNNETAQSIYKFAK